MADMVGIIHHGSLIYQGTMESLKSQGNDLEEVFLELTGGLETL